MATATADTLVAPPGTTRGRFGRGTPAVPFALQFDGPTSQQISLYCPVTGTVAAGAQVLAWYRQQGTSTWLGGVELYRSLPANAGLPGAVEYFAGMLLGMQPGTVYEVRCDYVVSGQATQSVTATHTTRAWPAAAGAPTITATPSTLPTILAQTLAAGTVLYIPDGSYTLPANAVIRSGGTAQAPVYVVGQSRTGAVLTRAWSGTAMEFLLQVQGSHVVIDGLGFVGSGVDSGQNAFSRCIAAVRVSGQTTPSQNITIRNCRARGFDVFDGTDEAVLGRLTYNNDIGGNNPPSLIGVVAAQGGFEGQDGWNDTAFRMPGDGCELFGNTLFGFGDTSKFTDAAHSAGFLSRACYSHQNLVLFATDDGLGELDDAARNCALYRNTVMGASTLFSADDTFGGPFVVALNTGINIARHPFKLEGRSQGVTVANNTLVERGRMAGRTAAIQMPTGANPVDWRYVNNLLVSNTTGDTVQIDSGTLPGLRVSNNGYTQDTGFKFGAGVRSATLAQAKIDRPAIHATDVLVEAQPFATAVPLGPDFTVQYTGNAVVALAPGSAARGAGVHIPGITDGFTGAAPDIGAAITGQPAVVPGAVFAPWDSLSAMPTPTLPAVGSIGALGSNTLLSVMSDNSWRSFLAIRLLGSWNGAAQSVLKNTSGQVVDVLYCLNGGGHADTGYDGTLAYSLRNQAWTVQQQTSRDQHSLPDDATYGENTRLLHPDTQADLGPVPMRPTSHHSYQHIVGFDSDEPNGPALVLPRRSAVGSTSVIIPQSHRFSLVSKTWGRAGPLHTATSQSVHLVIKDRLRQRLVRVPNSDGTDVYSAPYTDPALPWTLTTQPARTGFGWNDTFMACGAHDPVADVYLASNFTGANALRAMSAANLASGWVVLNTTGAALPTNMHGAALIYRSATGTFVLPDTRTTAAPTGLWEIARPASSPLTNAWTVTWRPFTGTSKLARANTVTEVFERFQYIAAWDCLVVCPSPGDPLEVWRL